MSRHLALLLTFATGASGLVYQVTWERYLAALLGSHGEATAAVLGLFLGGLAGGYAIFGEWTRRRVAAAARSGAAPRLLAAYGAVEAGIGVWALLFPWLFAAVRGLSIRLPELAPGPAFALDVALAALLLLPPTLLMGGTIPMLTQGLAASTREATRIHALVYGLNTAGAVLGTLVAGFWMIAAWGFPGTLRAMAAVNLLAGAVFYRMGDEPAARRALPAAGPEPAPAVTGLAAYSGAALLSGFAMMTLEVVAIRLGALCFGSSEYAFSVAVAVFVACIAAGSLLIGLLPRIPDWLLLASQLLLIAVLWALYTLVPAAPLSAHRLRMVFSARDVAFHAWWAAVFAASALCLAPAVLLSGASLPLIFDHLRRCYGELGQAAGRLYAWNTAGSLLGALIGGYALLFALDLHHTYRIAVSALGLGALLLATALGRERKRSAPAWLAATCVVGLIVPLWRLPAWPPGRLAAGLYRLRVPLSGEEPGAAQVRAELFSGGTLPFYDDDPGVTVSVRELSQRSEVLRGLSVNGKQDSSSWRDLPTTVLLGVLPAMLADAPRRAFVVGFGTGVSAGELAELAPVREVVVAEISPGVVKAAPLFDFANHGASHHPKILVARSDAYRSLQRASGHFDVISSEPSNPWVTGVEMLYTREFLSAARERLTPGGVYCQWFHQYEVDQASLSIVLRTFAAVFDHVAVWHGLGSDLFLLGFRSAPEPGALLDRLARRASEPDFAAALARAEVPSLPALLSHELLPLGVLAAARLPGPLHTLEHPILSHAAARAFFRGGSAELPFTGYGEAARVGREAALLPRHLAGLREPGREQAFETAAAEACRRRADTCAALLASWAGRDPGSARLAAQMEALRRRAPEFGGAVDTARVGGASSLFPAGPDRGAAFPVAPVSLANARRGSQLFQGSYAHAAPYSPERLLALWRGCTGDRQACAAGAEAARKLVEEGRVTAAEALKGG